MPKMPKNGQKRQKVQNPKKCTNDNWPIFMSYAYMMLMIISDSKNGPKTRENSQIWWGWVKIGDKMEKCYFLKIPQWPDFENLGGHSHHQDVPKNPRAGHGTFFFIRITFSSHVGQAAKNVPLTQKCDVTDRLPGMSLWPIKVTWLTGWQECPSDP